MIIETTLKTVDGKPFLVAWDREAGVLSFPNGQDDSCYALSLQEVMSKAERHGMVELWPPGNVFWQGKADLKDSIFVRAVLQAAGLSPYPNPPGSRGMELPPELASIDPWTPYPPLPQGAIA